MDVKNYNTIPLTIPIKKIEDETSIVRTFKFDLRLDSKPGQFVMLWIPGADQKPMSVAYEKDGELWLTVMKIGPATEALFKKKKGDLLGITGPFGTYFDIKENEHIAIVAGGCGGVPVYYAATTALEKGCEVEYVVSAGSKEKLLFVDKLKKLPHLNLHVVPPGQKIRSPEILKKVIAKNKIDRIFVCSNELAMKNISDIAYENKIFCQLSLERYMKCGFGVCGQCVMDPIGICICKQGPVLNNALVRQLSDFGKYYRDSIGKKVEF